MWVNLKMNDQINHNLDLYINKRGKEGAWVTQQVYICFAARDWFKQSFLLLQSQREVITWQVTVHRYLKFIFDQLCQRASHLFLESDHLMVIREKNPLYKGIWAWHTETILNMLIKLPFPRFWKTATYFSLVDFVISCLAFCISSRHKHSS